MEVLQENLESKDSVQKSWLSHGERFAQQMAHYNEDLWKRDDIADVEVTVQGKTYKCHSSVLCTNSPLLRQKFVNIEGVPKCYKVFLLQLSVREFEVLVRYMYTGILHVTCNCFFEVYKAASILQMKDVLRECVAMLQNLAEVPSYFYSYVISKRMSNRQQSEMAYGQLMYRFEEAVMTKEFFELEPDLATEILSGSEIGARSEVVVFIAALRWLNYSYVERQGYALRMMKCVRFSTMTQEEILACYYPPFLQKVVEIPEVVQMLLKASQYIAARQLGQEKAFRKFAGPERVLLLEEEPLKLWSSSNQLTPDFLEVNRGHIDETSFKRGRSPPALKRSDESLSFLRRNITNDDVRKEYSKRLSPQIQTKTVKEKKRMYPTDSWPDLSGKYSEVNEANPKILVFGGMNQEKRFKLGIGTMVLSYDPTANKWNRFSTLPVPLHQHCAAVLDGCIYIVGGCDVRETIDRRKFRPMTSCFKFNLGTLVWTPVANMNYNRLDHGVTTLGGFLYAVGGEQEEGKLLKTIEKYDPSQDKWTVLSSDLCCGRKAMSVAAHQERLWIAGGFFQPETIPKLKISSFVECYDPLRQMWMFDVSHLPHPLCFHSLVSWNKMLFCVGGITRESHSTRTTSTSDILYFDEDKNYWDRWASMPNSRSGAAAVICDDQLYVIGGFDKDSKMQLSSVISIHQNATSAWDTLAPLPTPLSGHAAVAI